MSTHARSDRIASVAALDDPLRRALYDFVSRSETPVGRDTAAEALHVSRRMAAMHLDRLAALGLLAVEYRRLHGRTGPGAGRPAKLYRRSDDEVAVSVPERAYHVVGELFVAAAAESIASGVPVANTLPRTAYEIGCRLGAAAPDVRTALVDVGYEPVESPDHRGGLTLRNCPFHRLSQQYTQLVCRVNLELLRGVADGAGDTSHTLVLDPGEGRCCVRLDAAA
ncbi:MAG TPA: transcriptional regulator [Micromonosporaceae bacterium]|nr:transcriptional regulator [Micromonosporaceae bacterium]